MKVPKLSKQLLFFNTFVKTKYPELEMVFVRMYTNEVVVKAIRTSDQREINLIYWPDGTKKVDNRNSYTDYDETNNQVDP